MQWIVSKKVSRINATLEVICGVAYFTISYLRFTSLPADDAYSVCLSMWLKYSGEPTKSSFDPIATAVLWCSRIRVEAQTSCVVSNCLLVLVIFFVIAPIHKTG